MQTMLWTFAVMALVISAAGELNRDEAICKNPNNDNKILKTTCTGVTYCENKIPVYHECDSGLFYDRSIHLCVSQKNSDIDCDPCVGKSDGYHRDIGDGCKSYFWCQLNENQGYEYCSQGLVFDKQLGMCFPAAIAAPCI